MAKFGGLWRMCIPMENSYQSGFTLKFAIFNFRFFLVNSKRTRFDCTILTNYPTPLFNYWQLFGSQFFYSPNYMVCS